MKKIFTILLIIMLVTSCTKRTVTMTDSNGEEIEVETGKYQVFNSLHYKITELYLYETGSSEKGKNWVEEGGLNIGDNITLTYDGIYETKLTLEYVAEDGDTAKYDKISIEEAPINLIPADERTGATIMEWSKPKGTGDYVIFNSTGGTVTELFLYEAGSEDKGVNYATTGIENNNYREVVIEGFTDSVWVLEFKADNGEKGKFDTLRIENVPIYLLSADARTGATAISFTQPE